MLYINVLVRPFWYKLIKGQQVLHWPSSLKCLFKKQHKSVEIILMETYTANNSKRVKWKSISAYYDPLVLLNHNFLHKLK